MFARLIATDGPVFTRLHPRFEELELRLAPAAALGSEPHHAPVPQSQAVLAIVQTVRTPVQPAAVVSPTTAPPSTVSAPTSLVNVPIAATGAVSSIIAAQPEETAVPEMPVRAMPSEQMRGETLLPQPEVIAVVLVEPAPVETALAEVRVHVERAAAPVVTIVDAEAPPEQTQALPTLTWLVGLVGLVVPGDRQRRKRHTAAISSFSSLLPAGR